MDHLVFVLGYLYGFLAALAVAVEVQIAARDRVGGPINLLITLVFNLTLGPIALLTQGLEFFWKFAFWKMSENIHS